MYRHTGLTRGSFINDVQKDWKYMEGSKLNQANSVINTPPIPFGMAIHPGSFSHQISLLVTDSSPNHRILSVSLIIVRTTILASAGHGPGQVVDPMGIAVDPNTRNIFVADTGNYRVQKFTPNFVPMKEWGSQGSGDSQFEFPGPAGIAIDSNGDIYVADSGNHRIQKFDNDGIFIKAWGGFGTANGKLNHPKYIAVESDDDIVVTELGNHRIQKFKSDSQFIRTWGQHGSDDAEFHNPHGVAIDSNGDIYVVDPGNSRVQKFDIDGNFIKSWGSFGHVDGQFIGPRCITFNGLTNSLFVSDPWNKNIQIFTTDGVFSGKVQFDIIVHP
jgi:tripartite motif-containing protein 71